MVYVNVFKHSSGTRKIHKAFDQLGGTLDLPKVKTFNSTDAALEYAEDSLLESLEWQPPAAGPAQSWPALRPTSRVCLVTVLA